MTEEARAAAEMAAVLQPLAPTNDTAAEYEQERTASLELIDFLKRRTSISNHSPALLDSLQASLNKGERPRALELRIDTNRVGWLFDVNDVWVLQYDVSWVSKEGAFALSPSLGLREDAYVDGSSTRPVQWFFDNLLPEEELRKSLAKEAQLAFEDVFGLLRHYGSESAGSLVLHPLGRPPAQEGLRELAPEELSARIRNLPIAPLTQGSPKRMSLAGAQHKMVVVAYSNEKGELEPTLFEPLPATPSTHILKPNSVAAAYPHSVANEYFSMRLAQRLKLDVPPVFRLYVPEPVYLITRFDRAQDKHTRHVSRLHVIDTCQLLNRSRVLKYDLARLETLAEAVEMTRSKALARRKLFQWMVFNTLLGNGDSHLKNLSFLVTRSGIELAPGYDMLCTAVYDTPAFADQNAIWPRTGLATTIPGANRFDQVTYAGLLEAGIALGLGAATAQRLLDGMLDRIEPAADYLLESLAKEYAETVARLALVIPRHPNPPSKRVRGVCCVPSDTSSFRAWCNRSGRAVTRSNEVTPPGALVSRRPERTPGERSDQCKGLGNHLKSAQPILSGLNRVLTSSPHCMQQGLQVASAGMKASARTPEAFVQQLQALPPLPNVFNPWRDFDEVNDSSTSAPRQRAEQLRSYLAQRLKTTRLVLVAEAPSWRGAKFTGIAMTSERILLNEHPNVPASAVLPSIGERTSSERQFPRCLAEQTATIVWSHLLKSGFSSDEFVLWNAFPCHPYEAGNPCSNRKPGLDELKVTADVLPSLLALLGKPKVVPVGKVAERALKKLGVSVPAVRHPAKGGAKSFRDEITQFVEDFPRQDVPAETQRA